MRIKSLTLISVLCGLLTAVTAYAGPQIQNWTAAKGTNVYFVETKGLPMVDIQVVFDAGSARDQAKFGIAALTSVLLDKGTEDWSVEEIAQRLEGVGAQLDSGVSRDTAWLSLRSLTQSELLDPALETLRGLLTAPVFAEKDFDREKNRTLVALKQLEESPAKIAEKAYYDALYPSHPYGHPASGTQSTVSQIMREELQAFFNKYYVANNAIIVIVGDLSRQKAESIAEYLIARMAVGAKAPDLPEVNYAAKIHTESIAFPSAQTHIHSGMPVVARGDEDYYALYVGNHILGGSGLVSRISEEIREKRGLSYSSSSYFFPLKRKGPFTMSLQTRNDQSEEALRVLNKTVATFIETGPTDAELVSAKKNITGGFVLRIDSNNKVANYVAMIGFYGLALDYLDSFSEKVRAVTREDIVKAFQKHLDVNRFQTILVGGGQQSADN